MMESPYAFRRGEVLAFMARAMAFGMILGGIATLVILLAARR